VSGVSLAPTLTGKGIQRTRDFLIHEAGNQVSIIQGQYKLIRSRKDVQASSSSKKKKRKKESVTMLFDLNADPAEKNNLTKDRPQLVKKLNTLLTAERVDEPAGFANTYHSWKVKTKNGDLGLASNWTEYVYENGDETYMHENGSPKSSWCARINESGSALARKDAEFLALEVAGSLTVKKGTRVVARNELRIPDRGHLALEGGMVESVRWVDVQSGARFDGYGIVKADFFSHGTLSLSAIKPLVVQGVAYLSGELKLTDIPSGKMGKSLTVLKANLIAGGFSNNEVSIGGKNFSVFYTPTSVTVEAK
jgi:hypothetical protein